MSENVCERELGKASKVKILLHRRGQNNISKMQISKCFKTLRRTNLQGGGHEKMDTAKFAISFFLPVFMSTALKK